MDFTRKLNHAGPSTNTGTHRDDACHESTGKPPNVQAAQHEASEGSTTDPQPENRTVSEISEVDGVEPPDELSPKAMSTTGGIPRIGL